MVHESQYKTPDTNMGSKLLSNNRTWMDFIDKDALSNFPGKDQWREKLIYTMLTWSEDDNSLEVLQFCKAYKIPRRTLKEWADAYDDVKVAYEEMKLMIACNRRVGSMTKKLDGGHAYKDMHVLDTEWLEINKYHSDMKKDEDRQPTTFNINLDKPRIVTKQEMLENEGKE